MKVKIYKWGQDYDKSADIWSLGCVFYEIFTNRPPFIAKNDDALYKKIVEVYIK